MDVRLGSVGRFLNCAGRASLSCNGATQAAMRLAKLPEKIMVAEVIEVIQGSISVARKTRTRPIRASVATWLWEDCGKKRIHLWPMCGTVWLSRISLNWRGDATHAVVELCDLNRPERFFFISEP